MTLSYFILVLFVATAFSSNIEEAAVKKRHTSYADSYYSKGTQQQPWQYGTTSGHTQVTYNKDHHQTATEQQTKIVTITKHVPIEVPKPYPVHIEKRIPYPVPQPYPVHVPRNVPVPVEVKVPVHIPKPYPVTVEKKVPYPVPQPYPVPVEKKVPVPYEVRVPVPVPKPYPVQVPKEVPVYIRVTVPKPYPVYVNNPQREVPQPQPVYGVPTQQTPYTTTGQDCHQKADIDYRVADKGVYFGATGSHGTTAGELSGTSYSNDANSFTDYARLESQATVDSSITNMIYQPSSQGGMNSGYNTYENTWKW